jgi:small subunit ribosomal protein S8
MKKEITRILKDQGYILDYKIEENPVQDKIKIALKYHPTTKQPAIRKIQRISRPGLRKYSPVETMPRVLSGLGIAIISTSKGLMTDKEAKRMNMGGEVICYVY